MIGKYPVITLCGSTRFKDAYLEAQKRLTLAGNIVISVGLFGHSGDDEVWTEGTKEMLDDMHKRKIDMADGIYVINVGGYIGQSTRSEIEYARSKGKTIEYLEENTFSDKLSPSQINELKEGEIFVFGSNARGLHMGGAARVAMEKFGAIWGVGEGLQGQSYAIPTMEGLNSLKAAVNRFSEFATQHEELKFYVTAIGCGIAGYTPEQIAPFFIEAARLRNVYLPLSFWKVILNYNR
jgi:uroporphyrinogen-III decarboxylase